MIYKILADTVVLIHLCFILYVVFGGVFLFWHKRYMWFHLVCVVWAAFTEFFGWICPLTDLEQWLRKQSGGFIYHTDFIDRYFMPLIYPSFLSRELQIFLGVLVIVINLFVYGWVFWGNKIMKQL